MRFCKREIGDTEPDRHKLSCENIRGQLGAAVLGSFDTQIQAEETLALTQLFDMGKHLLHSRYSLSLCLCAVDVFPSPDRAFSGHSFAVR